MSKNGPFAYLLYYLGAFEGKKTSVKRQLPEWLLTANNRIKREFISGFIAGDGCRLSMNKNVDNIKIHCGVVTQTCDKNLLTETINYVTQVSEMINEFGINSNITHNVSSYDENKYCCFINFIGLFLRLGNGADRRLTSADASARAKR